MNAYAFYQEAALPLWESFTHAYRFRIRVASAENDTCSGGRAASNLAWIFRMSK